VIIGYNHIPLLFLIVWYMGATLTFNIKVFCLFNNVKLLKNLLQWMNDFCSLAIAFWQFSMMSWATKATPIIIINLVSVELLHKLTEND